MKAKVGNGIKIKCGCSTPVGTRTMKSNNKMLTSTLRIDEVTHVLQFNPVLAANK
jgi:hypothetical protein